MPANQARSFGQAFTDRSLCLKTLSVTPECSVYNNTYVCADFQPLLCEWQGSGNFTRRGEAHAGVLGRGWRVFISIYHINIMCLLAILIQEYKSLYTEAVFSTMSPRPGQMTFPRKEGKDRLPTQWPSDVNITRFPLPLSTVKHLISRVYRFT
ncbi:hypothetical protein GWK47_046390 [Chionoecetes opilio]|uniref:Uncharacterized protein n=1 Tax=Chionoecetes opilio TaxID=41210 RepID=A0A8J5CH12_CHIOP|nr:hypothetical protein GWK47_046390 [Chionoecetes opilio]